MFHNYAISPATCHKVIGSVDASNGTTQKLNGLRSRLGAEGLQSNRGGRALFLALACCLALVASGCGSGSKSATSETLQVLPGIIDFGTVTVGQSIDDTVSVLNTGSVSVNIAQLSVAGQTFSVAGTGLPVSIPAGRTQTFKIGFTPVTAADYSGQVALIDASANQVGQVMLHGRGTVSTGTAAASPQLTLSTASLSFGSVTVNTPTTQPVTLTSTGTAPVTVNSAAISGAGFTIVGGTLPATLSPAQSITLQVQFLPTATGAAAGQLTISSNSTTGSTAAVALNGTGTAAPHEVDLYWTAPTNSTDAVAGYNIYRSTINGAFQLLNSSPDPQTAYIDSSVVSGATYNYIVKSVDYSGIESIASNQITDTIP